MTDVISKRLKLENRNLYWASKEASDVLTFDDVNNATFTETIDRVWGIKWNVLEALRDVEDEITDGIDI
jgi:hypothetical protein